MFKANAPNPYEELVGKCTPVHLSVFLLLTQMARRAAKTTDENLTSENWELILNICDKVQDEGEAGCVHDVSYCSISGKRRTDDGNDDAQRA